MEFEHNFYVNFSCCCRISAFHLFVRHRCRVITKIRDIGTQQMRKQIRFVGAVEDIKLLQTSLELMSTHCMLLQAPTLCWCLWIIKAVAIIKHNKQSYITNFLKLNSSSAPKKKGNFQFAIVCLSYSVPIFRVPVAFQLLPLCSILRYEESALCGPAVSCSGSV